MTRQIEVTILGQSDLLGCPDDGQASLLAAVATVDAEMSAIRDAGRVKARERIAVLAALNLAYRLAERGADGTAGDAPAAPRGEARPAHAPPGAAAHAGAPADGGVDLDALLRRIDTALHDDGLLL